MSVSPIYVSCRVFHVFFDVCAVYSLFLLSFRAPYVPHLRRVPRPASACGVHVLCSHHTSFRCCAYIRDTVLLVCLSGLWIVTNSCLVLNQLCILEPQQHCLHTISNVVHQCIFLTFLCCTVDLMCLYCVWCFRNLHYLCCLNTLVS